MRARARLCTRAFLPARVLCVVKRARVSTYTLAFCCVCGYTYILFHLCVRSVHLCAYVLWSACMCACDVCACVNVCAYVYLQCKCATMHVHACAYVVLLLVHTCVGVCV